MDDPLHTMLYSVANENNYMDNGQDLIISSADGQNRRSTIDCGPKLANLRRYWRDYYVDPSRMGTSSSSAEASDSASSTTSEAAAVTATVEEEVDDSKVNIRDYRHKVAGRQSFTIYSGGHMKFNKVFCMK